MLNIRIKCGFGLGVKRAFSFCAVLVAVMFQVSAVLVLMLASSSDSIIGRHAFLRAH
jgi:hypothetical protein